MSNLNTNVKDKKFIYTHSRFKGIINNKKKKKKRLKFKA